MSTRNVDKRKKRRRRRRVKSKVKLIAVAVAVVIALGAYAGYTFYRSAHSPNTYGGIGDADVSYDDSFTLTDGNADYIVFDVGAGEAILAKSGTTEILIDTGDKAHAKALAKELKGRISGDLDYLVLTGPADGRTGGLGKILKKYNVGVCILGEMGEKDAEIREKLSVCKEVTDGTNLSYDIGTAGTFSVIKPDVSSNEPGDRSLVTYFRFGDAGFLALSDAGAEEVSRAYASAEACNVVVLARNGAEKPNMALPAGSFGVIYVASTVKEAGFPSDALREHLNSTMYSTCEGGTVEFTTGGSGVQLVEKKAEESENPEGSEDAEES